MGEVNFPENLLIEVKQAVAIHQPELNVSICDGIILLEGLFVVSGSDKPFDSFQVRIGITANFPREEPIVFETGGRIPREVDRHIYPELGNCCLGIWEEWLLTAPNHSFEIFLTGILHDYFVGQAHFEAVEHWPFGQRSHGDAGFVESFSDILNTRADTKTVIEHLELLSMNEIKGHHLCPCGSGRKLRQCHRTWLEELKQKIPADIARRMLKRISTGEHRERAEVSSPLLKRG